MFIIHSSSGVLAGCEYSENFIFHNSVKRLKFQNWNFEIPKLHAPTTYFIIGYLLKFSKEKSISEQQSYDITRKYKRIKSRSSDWRQSPCYFSYTSFTVVFVIYHKISFTVEMQLPYYGYSWWNCIICTFSFTCIFYIWRIRTGEVSVRAMTIIVITLGNQYIKITYSPFCSLPILADIYFCTNIDWRPDAPRWFCSWILWQWQLQINIAEQITMFIKWNN